MRTSSQSSRTSNGEEWEEVFSHRLGAFMSEVVALAKSTGTANVPGNDFLATMTSGLATGPFKEIDKYPWSMSGLGTAVQGAALGLNLLVFVLAKAAVVTRNCLPLPLAYIN